MYRILDMRPINSIISTTAKLQNCSALLELSPNSRLIAWLEAIYGNPFVVLSLLQQFLTHQNHNSFYGKLCPSLHTLSSHASKSFVHVAIPQALMTLARFSAVDTQQSSAALMVSGSKSSVDVMASGDTVANVPGHNWLIPQLAILISHILWRYY